ncbi:OmpA family protein [Brevundimonas vancanneytii]|uniref:Outer membrane protein II n=1 Tax=Brevundimonas vancanneytii TaxID=1325724 RepID=A0A4P1KL62_9CAUL|nr:OmpA family protein [Brevundimonas vancanneytii]VTO20231.1 Outer membrane protein II [Brevundimonas vancanneytii]
MKLVSAVVLLTAGLAAAGCAATSGYKERSDLVSNPSACADKRFEVYFVPDRATLTDAARQAIGMTATQLQGCQIKHVKVTGLADARSGTATANQTISEQRARAVAEALAGAGLPAPAFDIEASGAQGAVVGGVNNPLRRRTEVLIEVVAPR